MAASALYIGRKKKSLPEREGGGDAARAEASRAPVTAKTRFKLQITHVQRVHAEGDFTCDVGRDIANERSGSPNNCTP